MTESSENIVIQITQEHTPEPYIYDDYGGDAASIRCSAEGCKWDTQFNGTWKSHILNVINDHLGLFPPDFDDGYCTSCDDPEEEHGDEGCQAMHGGMGPADNMDVWEEQCDCAKPGPGVPAGEFHW